MTSAAILVATQTAAGQTVVKFKETNKLAANGDLTCVSEVKLPAALYTRMKGLSPNTAIILRQLGINQDGWQLVDSFRSEWDDHASTIRANSKVIGAARLNNDGRWESPLLDIGAEIVSQNGNEVVLTATYPIAGFGTAAVTNRLTLPEGATDAKVLKSPARLTYKRPVPAAPGAGEGSIHVDAKDQIMSCLAKALSNRKFADLWTARAAFHNAGSGNLTDYRVRFRLANVAEWSSWSSTPIVVPGQTVVDPYYPSLNLERVGKMTGNAKIALEVNYQYSIGDRRIDKTDTRAITLLARNQAIYSTMCEEDAVSWYDMNGRVPAILASMVTHEDPVVQQAAGLVCKQINGNPSVTSDKDARIFMEAAYNFMAANVVYQSPASGSTGDKFFQHIKFGRDVLRNRSGTCIDLAVLYGSLCEAVGLEPVLYTIPGHCFPAVRLPESGRILAVESTGIGQIPFKDAVNDIMAAKKTNQGTTPSTFEQVQAGQLLFIRSDITTLHKFGFEPMDLPAVQPDVLVKWGVKAYVPPAPRAALAQPAVTTSQKPNAPVTSKIVGTWSFVVEDNQKKFQVGITLDADGTAEVVIRTANAAAKTIKSKWTLINGLLAIGAAENAIISGKMTWINNDRFQLEVGRQTIIVDRYVRK
jgi:Transglutaminase-like superfamily